MTSRAGLVFDTVSDVDQSVLIEVERVEVERPAVRLTELGVPVGVDRGDLVEPRPHLRTKKGKAAYAPGKAIAASACATNSALPAV